MDKLTIDYDLSLYYSSVSSHLFMISKQNVS